MAKKETVWDKSFKSIKAEDIAFPSEMALELEGIFKKHLSPKASVLEVGSGTGELSAWLSSKGYKTTLFDLSNIALDLSKDVFGKHSLKGEFVQGDLFNMPFKDGSFDCVWNSGVMEHFSDKDIVRGLKEMARVSNDYVITLVPNAKAIFYRLAKWEAEKKGVWGAGEEYPKTSFQLHFKEAGLTPVFEGIVSVDWGLNWAKFITGNEDLYKILNEFYKAQGGDKTIFDPELGYLLLTIGTKKKNPKITKAEKETFEELVNKDGILSSIVGLGKVREALLDKREKDLKEEYRVLKEGEEWLKEVVSEKDRLIHRYQINKINRALGLVRHPRETLRLLGSRRDYLSKKGAEEKAKESVSLPGSLIKRIESDDRYVNILTNTYLYKDGSKMFLGGAERYLSDLAEVIAKFGYKTRVFQLSSKGLWEKKIGPHVEVVGVPAENSESLSATFYKFVKRGPIVLSPFTVAVESRPNSIGISHGVFWDSELAQKDRGMFKTYYEGVLSSIRNCDRLVSVDTNTINSIRSTNANIADRFSYIPNYVDTGLFKPVKRSDNSIVVLYPRRLYRPRGFYLLLNNLDRILTLDSRIKVHFVGQADPEEHEIMDEVTTKFPGRIIWDSFEPEQMHEAYQKADIAVIPTVASEGTSLSCLEAMACGNAVIATNVGGLPDLILNNYNGILISPEEDELYKAIKYLVENVSKRTEISSNAVKVAESFSKAEWVKEWEQVLKSHLEE